MNFQRPMLFWMATLGIAAATFVLLREILTPFLVGIVLAYLLDPLVTRLERLGFGRGVAALGIICLFYAAMIALTVTLTPIVVEEVALLIEKLPGYLAQLQAMATDPSRPWMRQIINEGLSEARQSTGELTTLGAHLSANLLRKLWSDGRALASIFSLLVVVPIVTFYLLIDWDQIIAAVDRLIPAAQQETVRALAREVHETIGVFLRGQGIICLILAAYYAVALELMGLNHAYLIGVAAGLISFIPYLGVLTGVVLSVSVALLQFWPDWSSIPIIVAIFVVGELADDNFLTPRLVGARVNLSPLLVMFAIAAFGSLFGFIGLLIAVPLAATIGATVRFFMSQGSEAPARQTAAAGVDAGNVPSGKRRWLFW
ncbi:MAG: AI-2E family transporter [Methylocystis sp.]